MRYLMDPLSFLPELVEALLPRHSPPGKVLVVSMELTVHNTNTWASQSRHIHLVFHRPGNYTKVLWWVTQVDDLPIDMPIKFELRSNHDSCWRIDGIEAPLHELCQSLEKTVTRDDPRDSPPIGRTLTFNSTPFAVRKIRSIEEDPKSKNSWTIRF